jgi:signal transduction histidine kinase
VAPPIHELVNRLASPALRAAESARIAEELGAEAFLVLLYDEAIGALTPAPGFPQTVPGGPAWRAFLKGPHAAGSLEIELPFPTQHERKLARVLVSEDAVFMLIGGEPGIKLKAFAETPLLAALLRAEKEQLASVGLATAARAATARATNLAAALDNARAEIAGKADELAAALSRADGLNEQLKTLNETLEQRIAERTSERNMLASIVETTDVFVMACDLDYNILAINEACANQLERVYGIRPNAGENLLALLDDQPEQRQQVRAAWARGIAGEEATIVQEFGNPARGRAYYEIKFRNLWNEAGERIGAYQFVTDVTERLCRERELAEAQEALRQSQKMETVGLLTGGIAHDFNNLLQIVSGNLDLLRQKMPSGSTHLKRYADRAFIGAERASTLTQRLLAFSRRQPLAPKAIDINRLIPGMSDLLHRTLGETIEVEAVLAPRLWSVEADPNQLENAIINLAINARDAMPEGGKLTIETQNTHLDHSYAAQNPEVSVGQYVLICISDTGTGMDAETAARAIEPFFTTKEVGRGTGLGLSMVYGFVKQSGGHIKIYSEPGEGTTVKMYLPRLQGTADEHTEAALPVSIEAAGDETILVCEDDEDVRAYSAEVLGELGYKVLEAADGPSALAVLNAHGHVDLLFTDVVLPAGMTGAVLAREAAKLQPGIKTLFTTGYARNAIVHHGRLDAGVDLITKPFSYSDLAARVRDVLDRPA